MKKIKFVSLFGNRVEGCRETAKGQRRVAAITCIECAVGICGMWLFCNFVGLLLIWAGVG